MSIVNLKRKRCGRCAFRQTLVFLSLNIGRGMDFGFFMLHRLHCSTRLRARERLHELSDTFLFPSDGRL